jgi:nicotinate-nucleotide pyrophosphorylase (carboxylating)
MDTRKTTPNFRFPEKWAVRIGGGINHRMGLYDALLIKDNHVRALGSLTQALKRCEKYRIDQNLALPLIVEVQSLKEVAEVVKFNFIDRILLDNMLPFTIIKALDLVAHQCPCEASGNITAKNILAYAQTGVSCVSLGALTYAAKAIDLSLKFR